MSYETWFYLLVAAIAYGFFMKIDGNSDKEVGSAACLFAALIWPFSIAIGIGHHFATSIVKNKKEKLEGLEKDFVATVDGDIDGIKRGDRILVKNQRGAD